MRWRIRSQLLLPVLLLLVGVAGISVATALAAARQARTQIESRLGETARFLADDSTFPLQGDVLRQLQPLSGAHFLLESQEGRSTSLPADPGPLPIPVAEDWHALHLDSTVELNGEPYLAGSLRVRRWPYQGGTLTVFYPESVLLDARRQAVWPSVVLGTSAGLAALALAVVQAHRLGRRVQELERRTRLIAGGDFSPMPLPTRQDEIYDLARSVNEMAGRLAQYQKTAEQTERLRLLGQVSGGLAHQLRNGLTGARLAVQLYLREAPPDQDVSPLEVALRQLALLETHVKRFLDLGRSGPSRQVPCDLGSLVADAVELLLPQCRHAGIRLRWEAPAEAFPLRGDPGQLSQVIVNLLGNAIEAAGPGGWVELRLRSPGAGGLRAEVYDSGPGPPAEVRDRLFEPFVSGKPEGVGLGLAVARQVVEGHGGTIGWERSEAGTCFAFELPAARSEEGSVSKDERDL